MKKCAGALAAALLASASAAVAQEDDLADLLGFDEAVSPSSEPEPATEPTAATSGSTERETSSTASAGDESEAEDALSAASLDVIPVAEEQAPADTIPKRPSSRLVEEIVVTAQKREENLKDVPIAIQAYSQERLDVLGLQSVQDIQRATPGFTVTTAAAFNVVFLRGVGSDAFLPGVDSSVPFYLDGIPLLAAQGASDTLGRVERIEVLKGPQGTLFGRNATGGTISIVTPEPGPDFEADLKLELGSWNTRNIVAFANIPVTDWFSFSVSGFSNERDNILTNSSSGEYPDTVFGRGGRAKARFDLTQDLAITLSANYNAFHHNSGLAFQNVRPAPVLALGGLLLPADPQLDRNIAIDGDFGSKGYSKLFAGTVTWNLPWVETKLMVSDQMLQPTLVDGPFDGTQRPVVDAHGAGKLGSKQFNEQQTVELQFLSNENTPLADHFQWVFGGFYLKSRGGFEPIVFKVAPNILNELLPSFGLPALPGVQGLTDLLNAVLGLANLPPILGDEGVKLANYGLLDSEGVSAYAQGTWFATDTIDITAGLRYQDEKRRLIGARTSYLLEDGTELVLPLPQGGKDPLNAHQLSARLAFQWRPFGGGDQIYASWARAYKNPTYNTVNVTGNLFGTMVPLKEERVDTYELGMKAEFFDGAVQFNPAVFYTIQKNPLSANVSIPSGGIANFTNAGEAEIKGVDGDFLILPMPVSNPGLAIIGGFSYLDAIYTEFKNGRGYDDLTGLGFGNGGASLPARDLSGKRIPRVPEWSWSLGVNQRIDLSSGNAIEIGADAFYTSKIYFLPQNSEYSVREPTTLFNARVSYFYTPWNVELTAFINNITDEMYAESAFVTDFGTALMVNEDPRLYGLRMKYSF